MRTIRYKDLGQNNLEQLKQELRVNVKSELPRTGGTGVLLNLGLRVNVILPEPRSELPRTGAECLGLCFNVKHLEHRSELVRTGGRGYLKGGTSLPRRGRRVDLEMFLGGALVGFSVSSPALPLLSSLIGPICKARDLKANPGWTE